MTLRLLRLSVSISVSISWATGSILTLVNEFRIPKLVGYGAKSLYLLFLTNELQFQLFRLNKQEGFKFIPEPRQTQGNPQGVHRNQTSL